MSAENPTPSKQEIQPVEGYSPAAESAQQNPGTSLARLAEPHPTSPAQPFAPIDRMGLQSALAPRAAAAEPTPAPSPEVVVYTGEPTDNKPQPDLVVSLPEAPQKQHTAEVPFIPQTDTTPISDEKYEMYGKIHSLDMVSIILPSTEHGYKTDRTVEHYQKELQGIDGTLDHIRQHSENGIVVDLGAGQAVATNEMAQKEAATGGGLTFVATSLTDIRADTSSPVPYVVTSSEDLRGFPPSSVSGFIAVFSLYHTYSPEKTITNLDEALEPGGVIKANFRRPVNADSGLFIMSPELINEELRKKGYDIATTRTPTLMDGIMLAIKPGGTSTVTAQELLDRDFALHQEALSDAVKRTTESTLPDEKKAPRKPIIDAQSPDPRNPITGRVPDKSADTNSLPPAGDILPKQPAEIPSQQPEGRIAKTGDYEKKLSLSPFRDSPILRQTAAFIESGEFETGSRLIREELEREGIQFEDSQGYRTRGTRNDAQTGGEVIILPTNFSDYDPVMQIYELTHKYMSLMLQRAAKRDDPQFLRELFEMDLAYAQTLRVSHRGPSRERRREIKGLSDYIENRARNRITSLQIPPTS